MNAPVPKVSVLIVTHNYGRYLAECLDSVFRQTMTDFEVIVVDDGSTDETAAVVRAYPTVRAIVQERRGVGAARNRAVGESRGAFTAFLDADDFWPPDRLAVLLPLAEKAWPQDTLVFGRMENFLEDATLRESPMVRAMAERTQGALPSLGLLPRDLFARLGGFDESLVYGEDSDLGIRWQLVGIRHLFCDNLVLYRRLHGANLSMTARSDCSGRDTLKFFARQLRARRGGKPPCSP